MRKATKCLGVAMRRVFLTTAVVMSVGSMAKAADIPLSKTEVFAENAFDEDIRTVLRKLLATDSLAVIFRPDVKGSVTYDFTKTPIPLLGAFNKLMEENGLDYEYNADTKTVTILVKGLIETTFIPLKNKNVTDEAIKSAAHHFGLDQEVTIIYDAPSKTIMLKGKAERVKDLSDLIERLETSATERDKAEAENFAAASSAALSQAEAMKRQAEAQQAAYRLSQEQKEQNDIDSIRVEVIKLHYASVGPTKVQFQGENVTIPGVIDTLNNLLGVTNAKAAAQNETAKPSAFPTSSVPSSEPGHGGGTTVDEKYPSGAASPGAAQQSNPSDFHGTISADVRTNSVIVRGTPREIQQVKDLLPKLDKPMEQVEIEVIIANTTQDFSRNLGLSLGNDTGLVGSGAVGGAFSTLPPSVGSYYTTPTTAASTVNNNVSPLTLAGTTTGVGSVASLIFRGSNATLNAQLNALESNNQGHIVDSPRVVTIDNVAAKVSLDGTTFLAVPAAANAPGGYMTVPAGTTLKITPSVLRREDVGGENMVRMVIEAEATAVVAPTTATAGPGRNGEQIQTQVVIPDGSTFIMGGLSHIDRTENLNQVPLLGDIPVVGELFKNRDTSRDYKDIMFFITPKIVPKAALYAKDVAEKRYLQAERAEIDRVADGVRKKSMLLDLGHKSLQDDE